MENCYSKVFGISELNWREIIGKPSIQEISNPVWRFDYDCPNRYFAMCRRGRRIVNDIDRFMAQSRVIVTNRCNASLDDIADKVYTATSSVGTDRILF